MMKFFVLAILSTLIYSAFSETPSQEIPETVLSSKNAVWKIRNKNGLRSGTGFFITPNHFVTNFHVIANLLGRPATKNITAILLNRTSIKDIILSQKGSSHELRVKRITSLSALYDLAILEIEQEVSEYLSLDLAKWTIPPQEENLYMIGYPKGSFKIVKRSGSYFYENSQFYSISISYSAELSGASGSPVLNEQGQVFGVQFKTNTNLMDVIKTNHLRNLFEQKIGLLCSNLNPKSCIKKEIGNLKKLAKQGDILAQFNLAEMYFSGDGIRENQKIRTRQLIGLAKLLHKAMLQLNFSRL